MPRKITVSLDNVCHTAAMLDVLPRLYKYGKCVGPVVIHSSFLNMVSVSTNIIPRYELFYISEGCKTLINMFVIARST